MKIRCANVTNGTGPCDRFLGEVNGLTLRILCPKCGGWHEVSMAELIVMHAMAGVTASAMASTEEGVFL